MAGRWAIVLRKPMYDKDRMDPVDPSGLTALITTLPMPSSISHPLGGQLPGFIVVDVGLRDKTLGSV